VEELIGSRSQYCAAVRQPIFHMANSYCTGGWPAALGRVAAGMGARYGHRTEAATNRVS
jgi:hypothetical protein